MGEHKTLSVSNVYVPNEYEVYLGNDDHEKLSALGDALTTELANYLIAFAGREGWTMVAAPRIELARGRRLARGRVRHRDAHRPGASRRRGRAGWGRHRPGRCGRRGERRRGRRSGGRQRGGAARSRAVGVPAAVRADGPVRAPAAAREAVSYVCAAPAWARS